MSCDFLVQQHFVLRISSTSQPFVLELWRKSDERCSPGVGIASDCRFRIGLFSRYTQSARTTA